MFTGTVGVSNFRSAFPHDLNGNEPFAVSTGEKRSTASATCPRYNGHSNPSATSGRGHWIAAPGYGGCGSTAGMTGYFDDPMFSREAAVASAFSYNLNSFCSNFVAGRGIVW
jgi:hypothetical protein